MDDSVMKERYERMEYRKCGDSGLLLPVMSLGMWHNFGDECTYINSRNMILTAFQEGITHFDLANNYGTPPGSAEKTFGRILKEELSAYRDEIVVSTKAGYRMWPGPYGEWGSKKALTASLDQSLKRMGLEYVDVFYHHRPDPDTPLEETMDALAGIVRSGKALYAGISNYNARDTKRAFQLLKQMGVKCLVHQMRYSMLDRENKPVLSVLEELGIGGIAFSPLAQGLLTGKYRDGIPEDSRAAGASVFLNGTDITESVGELTNQLEKIANKRNQSLAQMALSWTLNQKGMTSVILGASRPEQILNNIQALDHMEFDQEELNQIERVLDRAAERGNDGLGIR